MNIEEHDMKFVEMALVEINVCRVDTVHYNIVSIDIKNNIGSKKSSRACRFEVFMLWRYFSILKFQCVE